MLVSDVSAGGEPEPSQIIGKLSTGSPPRDLVTEARAMGARGLVIGDDHPGATWVLELLGIVADERMVVCAVGTEAGDEPRPIGGAVARRWLSGAGKRLLDVTGAVLAMVLMLPVLIVLTVMVKVDSPGPAFFVQHRLGRNGRPFRMFKFRTMVEGAHGRVSELVELNDADGPLFKVRSDPRVTRVGHHLRRLSLDELPQLWNVLRGEMSLVGPRPALLSEAGGWPVELFARLSVSPGITGLWQVQGRSDSRFADYLALDLEYVSTWSMRGDLAILVRTVPAVVRRRGAY